MFCKYCGNELKEDDRFCPTCGRKNEDFKSAVEIKNDNDVKEKKKNKKGVSNKLKLIIPLSFLLIVLFLGYLLVLAPKLKYDKAVSYYENNEYDKAYELFKGLGDYKNSSELLKAVRYDQAKSLYEKKEYQAAYELFQEINDYKDSNDLAKNALYDQAIALYEDGDHDAALDLFTVLGDYKRSSSYLLKISLDPVINAIEDSSVGDFIKLGVYEQNNRNNDGKEEIEWIVLAKEGNKTLLISRYALDCRVYNDTWVPVTWSYSTLRKWLNDVFYHDAFSEEEKSLIAVTNVAADKNPEFNVFSGSDSTDKIFLLSIREANRYFNSSTSRRCEPTSYTRSRGMNTTDTGYCWWWLRTPGHDATYAASVDQYGAVNAKGNQLINDGMAIRPAMWVDLSLLD